ncbi:MAG: DUF5696 domain-containing protein [Capsulimonadaceae bacterium]|nr:DUF5696 domain-containing protein [Capsulimonadaceae bacterium]
MTNFSLRTRAFSWLLIALATVLPFCPVARADDEAPVAPVFGGVTSLDDLGFYGISYRYTDGRTGRMPMGWCGHMDANTGISAIAMGTQNGKRAYLLHPIWHSGAGDTDQIYRLALPKATSISLAFSIAMKNDVVGKSDGVTFRVFVNGEKLFDENKADSVWADYKFDLTKYAGQTITLVFEADPGPNNDPSFDYGFWGDRRLICTDVPGGSVHRAFSTNLAALDGHEAGWGGASPTHFSALATAGRILANASSSPTDLLDGLEFRVTTGKSVVSLPYANGAILDLVALDGSIVPSNSPNVRCAVTQSTLPSGSIRRTAVYMLGDRTITVTADIDHYDGSSARIALHSSDPYIAAVHFGRIGPSAYYRRIAVPYYNESIGYSSDLGLFSNIVVDYGVSHASALSHDFADYRALTNGNRIAMNEVAYYALSPDPDEVLPTPIGDPSPFRQTMGDLAVIDYWGGDAVKYANLLDNASTYGITKFLTIVHDWQHGGYDQQLPTVLPASSFIGGNEGLITLTTKAKALGERIALHENYVDFYPNGPLWNPDDVAVSPEGKKIPAWSEGGRISYVLSPVRIMKYARTITAEVHNTLGTNASYLDVHSSYNPFSHTDARADRSGAGEYLTCLNATKELWQYLRDVHGGPVLGEGCQHWFWSGMLDGVEAQLGVGPSQNETEDVPLFVDFDLLKIHPRQINHGMGYLSRWLKPENGNVPTQARQDHYRMQELAFGHSAFVDASTLNIPFMFEEHNLAIPVTSRYATAKVRSIAYEVNGEMLDTSGAIAAEGVFDRVRIAYDNGLTIWANTRETPWTVTVGNSSYVLPMFGWLASGDGVLAYTARRDGGATASFAKTTASVYANARTEMVCSTTKYATPTAIDVKQIGARQFQVRFGFDVAQKIPDGYQVFVHLVSAKDSADGGIVAQFPAGINALPSTWPVGARMQGDGVSVTLPDTLKDGTYEIRVGTWSPSAGDRLKLNGLDDGASRYRVASVTVSNGGRDIAGSPIVAPSPAPEYAPNTHTADFGVLATNGSVKMTKLSPGKWKLIPLPRDHEFQVALNGRMIDPAFAQIRAAAIDASGKVIEPDATLPVRNGRSVLDVHLPVGAVGYLLTAAK